MRFWLVVLLALTACHREPPPAATPDDAYRRFVSAVSRAREGGDTQGLLDFFDAPTRASLQARADAASKAAGKDLGADAADQLLAGGALAQPVSAIQVQNLTADHATLQVALDGGPGGAVQMVLENGRWRIHLDALPKE